MFLSSEYSPGPGAPYGGMYHHHPDHYPDYPGYGLEHIWNFRNFIVFENYVDKIWSLVENT